MAEYINKQDVMNMFYPRPTNIHFVKPLSALIREKIETIPAADVRPVVLCRDCVYWQKPQVWQNDGTFRDYEPGEYENGSFFGGVSLEIGVNFGSFCALYDREHRNELPQFMNENDFCSKGYKREES